MAGARCSCGFIETNGADETIVDHLLWVFTPEDDKGTDGRVHLEGDLELACLCGLGASTPSGADLVTANDGDDSPPSGITRPSGHCHHLAHGRSRRLHDLRRLFTMIAVKAFATRKLFGIISGWRPGGQIAGLPSRY